MSPNDEKPPDEKPPDERPPDERPPDERPKDENPHAPETPESWGRFLSGVVHELKTPVSSLGWLAELLEEEGASHAGEKQQRYRHYLQELASDLKGMLDDLGRYARLVDRRVEVSLQPVSLETLLDRVRESARPRTWEQGAAVDVLTGPEVPASFLADSPLLEEILVGLVETAAVLSEGPVLLHAGAQGEELHFVVEAGGVPETTLSALFDPFEGGTGRKLRQKGGRSLALLIARGAARILGGDVSVVACRPGTGAFRLTLPAAPAVPRPAPSG